MEQPGLQELALPLAVVTIVGMMVFPLPAGVLDALLGANLSFSLLLLFTSIYTRDPERFTVLPSLLLLSTLFRLGLNVSTTRQLLTSGEAPQIVQAFGDFVVGGNVLAGCVVFLIVTLVQFIVVSKGAERVAEVAARFTLDAMPGKQIAIDADIRAGILSLAEARERRRELQRESKLFGALDGAMKFVKGDAIAGLCIAVLNIGAGFLAGVFQLGMSLHEALSHFTIFTIGDSLVSQVPALLVSVSAGIAVTRVGEAEGSTMASELAQQLGSEPRVLFGTAGLLFLLAFSPGLPTGLFLVFAGGVWALARKRGRERAAVQGRAAEQGFSPRATPILLLALSERARDIMLASGALPRDITDARREIYEELGVLLPEPEWSVAPGRTGAWVGVQLEGVLIGERELDEAVFPERAAAVVKSLFLEVTRFRIEELIDDTQTRTLLELNSALSEDLINGMVPKQVSVTTLTRLLRDLVAEGVSIRSLRGVLQGVAEHCLVDGPIEYPLTEPRYLGLLASLRVHLRRQILAGLPRSEGRLSVWELSPSTDRLLEQAILAGCPVPPELADAVVRAIEELPPEPPPIVLTSQGARKLLFQLARPSGRRLAVIAGSEVLEEPVLNVMGELLSPPEEACEGDLEMGEDAGPRDERLAA